MFLDQLDLIARDHEIVAEGLQEKVADKLRVIHKETTNNRKNVSEGYRPPCSEGFRLTELLVVKGTDLPVVKGTDLQSYKASSFIHSSHCVRIIFEMNCTIFCFQLCNSATQLQHEYKEWQTVLDRVSTYKI